MQNILSLISKIVSKKWRDETYVPFFLLKKTTKNDQVRKHHSCPYIYIYGTTFTTKNISRKGNSGHQNFLKGTLDAYLHNAL